MKTYSDGEIEASAERTAARGRERDVTALRRVGAVALRRDEVDAELRAAVAAARGAGWSWAAIAEQLGVTVQAAHKRFAPQVA